MLARVRSGPRPGIFLADLVWLTRATQVAVVGLPRASLRTRDEGFGPAWKVARLRDLSARRRVGVQGVAPGSVLLRFAPQHGRRRALPIGPAAFPKHLRVPAPWRRSGRRSRDRQEPPMPHTRRRADRSRNLAIFRARAAATSRVRRDARDGPQRCSGRERVSQARTARKMSGLDPDRTRASIEACGHGPSAARPTSYVPATPRKRRSLPPT